MVPETRVCVKIEFDSKHVDAMITSLKYTIHSQHVYVGSIKKCPQENS
jgi:hypothetical protein